MSFKVVGIGEVLWDLLPSGAQLGGAPANFVYHAHTLGADASVVTRVGNDQYGDEIRRRFAGQNIAGDTVQVDEAVPTGTVEVSLSGNGIPHFTIQKNVAWDRLEVTKSALAAVRRANAICFGTLAQRSEPSKTSIQQLVSAASPDALRILDINLRQNYYSREVIETSLHLADVLKLNDSELPVLADMFALGDPVRQQMEQLAGKFELRLVALTRGAAGSLLFQAGQWSNCSSMPIDIVDTVGAGDAFTAALAMGLLQKKGLDEINLLADEVARHVCSHSGATPPLPKEICDRFVGCSSPLHTTLQTT